MIDETYDREPTLTDPQVVDLCKNGLILLERVVTDEINRQTCSFLDDNQQNIL